MKIYDFRVIRHNTPPLGGRGGLFMDDHLLKPFHGDQSCKVPCNCPMFHLAVRILLQIFPLSEDVRIYVVVFL